MSNSTERIQSISECFSEHYASITYEEIDAKQRHSVEGLIFDYFGVAIAGSRTTAGRIATKIALDAAQKSQSSIIGSKRRCSASDAAFANAIMAHALELDDVDATSTCHFGAPVVSAALAIGEHIGASGKDLVAAVTVGCELMARLSHAVNPVLRDKGFHTTAICGAFGAAAAASRMLRLRPFEMVSAIGLTGAQAGGLMEVYGPSLQKRFNTGPAARSGITSAIAAKYGFSGATTIFEGRYGFCAVYGDGSNPMKIVENLKQHQAVIEHKAYACGRPIHTAIDCAIALKKSGELRLDTISKIDVQRHPSWADHHLNDRPSSFNEAQFSLPYSIAVALVEGGASVEQYSEDRLQNPTILGLAKLVVVSADPSLPTQLACRIKVTYHDGSTSRVQVDHPLGSTNKPLGIEGLTEKFLRLTVPIIGIEQAELLIDQAFQLEALSSIQHLLKLTIAPTDSFST